jgi:Family of unknown function (DUF5683)
MPSYSKIGLSLVLLLVIQLGLFAQVPADSAKRNLPIIVVKKDSTVSDLFLKSTETTFKPSPRKALMLGLIFPGGGQIYNRKWWKLPIVYGGFATLGYFVVNNNRNYKIYRDAYIERYKGDMTDKSLYNKYKNIGTLKVIRDYWRRNRDFSIILSALCYGVTLLDATVDAHLYHFNVTDDLEGTVKPSLGYTSFGDGSSNNITPGLSLTFTLK